MSYILGSKGINGGLVKWTLNIYELRRFSLVIRIFLVALFIQFTITQVFLISMMILLRLFTLVGHRGEDKYSRKHDKYEATTSNEFVTFSRQYILIGSYSLVMFYVARVLLLHVHCRKALTTSKQAVWRAGQTTRWTVKNQDK